MNIGISKHFTYSYVCKAAFYNTSIIAGLTLHISNIYQTFIAKIQVFTHPGNHVKICNFIFDSGHITKKYMLLSPQLEYHKYFFELYDELTCL